MEDEAVLEVVRKKDTTIPVAFDEFDTNTRLLELYGQYKADTSSSYEDHSLNVVAGFKYIIYGCGQGINGRTGTHENKLIVELDQY